MNIGKKEYWEEGDKREGEKRDEEGRGGRRGEYRSEEEERRV